jgi:hypothetical protein
VPNKYRAESRESQAARKRERSCTRKASFASKAEAFQKGQRSYKCRFCGLWHRSGAFAKFVSDLSYFRTSP